MKNFILLLFLSFISFTVYGAKISSDELKIGKAGSVADKVINLGPLRQIRSNETSGVLEFSNDGALFKKLGSGSGSGGGGGVSVLLNASFEDGLVNWTNSGGTFTQETYVNSVEGNAKYGRFVTTGAGQYIETDLTTFADNISGGGMADFKFLQGDGAFNYEVLDTTGETISIGNLGDASIWLKAPTITFDVPVSGKIRIISTGAGTVDVDDAYLGSNKGITPVGKMSHFVGSALWPETASSSWSNSSDTFADFPANTFAPSPTIAGEVTVPDGDIPKIKIASAPKGFYTFTATGNFGKTNNVEGSLRFSDGSINFGYAPIRTNNAWGGAVVGTVFHDGTGDLDVSLQSADFGLSGGDAFVIDNSIQSRDLTIEVHFKPSGSETTEAFTPDQADFFIDVNIGGANDTLGVTASPLAISNPSWDMVVNKGSAKIPCDSNSATGLTCSVGNEMIGINFNAPRQGSYKACFSFNNELVSGAGFRLAQTTLATDTIIQQGNSISSIPSGTGWTTSRLCDVFEIGSVGEKEIKLFYEAPASGTIYADRAGGLYERDIHITVEMVSHNTSRPIIQNMIDTSFGSGMRDNSCSFNANATTNSSLCGSWIDGTVKGATGFYTVNILTGGYSDVPNCTMTVIGTGRTCNFTSKTASVLEIRCRDFSGTNTDDPFDLICEGER